MRTTRSSPRIGISGAASYLVGFRHHTSVTRRVCQNGYCVTLPSGWRYRAAGSEGNGVTYYYWNPDNALERSNNM
jgi:hypothetical protein